MGKHSKNNNDRAFFSNAERRAAAFGRHSSAMLSGHNTGANFKEAGWGTDARQLDSDSMKEIDACSLSLQPCADPVVTPQGVLYDRMVVVQYILDRKREIERATREWEAQQAGDAADAAGAAAQAAEARVEEFVARQEGLSAADLAQRQAARKGGGAGSSCGAVASTMGRSLMSSDTGKHAADTSFWVPSLTPEARTRVEKPDATVRCPVSGEPLRLKQLAAVAFTRADADDAGPDAGKKAGERFMCPLSKKPLSNLHPATVLRPSGTVISTQCVKDFIRKDMLDPFTDPPVHLKEKDIIALRVEGTGFASRTDEKSLKVSAASRPAGRF